MSPTARAAVVLAGAGALVLVLPVGVAALAVVAVAAAVAVDAWSVRKPPGVVRRVGPVLARGVPSPVRVEVEGPAAGRVVVRQPVPPHFTVEPAEGGGETLEAVVTARRRGRHVLAAPAVRLVGPLRLGRWDHRGGGDAEVLVYPDLPAARRLAAAAREARRGEGRRLRGPLGLGTAFELVRDYEPDDDVRQINWRATARLGRPMSNQYRVDQDREVVCLVDAGRLMAAPVGGGDLNRLDVALDAVAAVAMVADDVGDRCGAVAFDAAVRRQVPARRRGSRAVVDALFDLESSPVDSDYELAFRAVARAKRAFVLLLTDLLDESAASQLIEAVPLLARKHLVAVASVADPDVATLVSTPPSSAFEAYAATVAAEVLEARARVAGQLRRAGAEVVEAPPDGFAAACVDSYLRAKGRARL